jgi:hypothetical protein
MSEIVGVDLKLNGGDSVIQSVGSIKKQLREAQNEVSVLSDKFGATSKEAVTAAKRAAELKDRIGDAKALVDAFNPDAKFKAFSASISGVAGGFSALQGGMALLGGESENVQKSLLKVQSALALSQGLQAVGESIDSFKQLGAVIKTQVSGAFSTLKGAIASTGIGLLVVGLGLLVANFEKVKKAVLDFLPGLAKVGEFFGKLVDTVTDFIGVTSEASRALDKLKKDTEDSLKEGERFLELNADKYDQYTNQKFKADLDYKKKKLDFLNDEKLSEEDKNKFIAQAFDQRNRIIADADSKRSDAFNKQKEADRKKREEEFLKQQEEEKRRFDLQLKDELFYYDKRKAAREGKISTFDATKNVVNLTNDKIEADKLEKEKLKQQEADYQEFLKVSRETGLGSFLEAKAKEQGSAIATNEAKIASDKAAADAKKKLTEDETMAVVAGLNAVADLIGQQTVAGKALSIGAAIINTYQGATKALAQGGFLGIATAATVIASGLASVKKIISTPLPVPGGSGGGAVPSLSSASPLQPQTIASSQVTLDQRSINALGNQAIKAYVVENDITNAQSKVRKIERSARFG